MTRILKSFFLALVLAGISLLALLPAPVRAQGSDPAVAQVQGFYDALTASMKAGGSAKSRYDRLRPAVEKAFDLPAMTATAVGPGWASMSDADKKTLTEAFTRMTVASYAKNFDSYHGEKFPVEPASIARGPYKYVKSKLVGSETHVFNYQMHETGGAWKITDVLLEGNISQMAQKRSDFSSTLASGGPSALAKRIDAITDQTLR